MELIAKYIRKIFNVDCFILDTSINHMQFQFNYYGYTMIIHYYHYDLIKWSYIYDWVWGNIYYFGIEKEWKK